MADKTVVVRIVVRANQFSSGLRGASSDVERFAVDVEKSTQRAGSSALALGTASAVAGKLMLLGVGGAMVVSAKAAIDYESALAGVAKTTDLTGSAFARAGSPLAAFGEGLRSLSMRIPLNVNDLARIAELGGQLGIEVPNLIEFTEVMAALGVSTNLSADEAATGLARFSNIMGTSQTQFGRLGDVVVDLGNNLATTESEILTFGLRLAPVGKTVGFTEEEVLGLAGAFTSLGIPAERGGTALQRFFLDMDAAVDQGGESLERFADVAGMTVDEFVEAFRESPAEAFTAILRGLNQVEQQGGSAAVVLDNLGVTQQRSLQVLLAASSGWETVADSIGIANRAGEEGNALFEEAARRYGTSASEIQILSNAFNDLRIEVGSALLGSGGLSAGLDFLREFIRIIKDNLPLLGRLAAAMATVAAIRIGAGFLRNIQEGIEKLRDMSLAAEGMSRSSAAMRLGMLGVNTAVFGAVAIASILITKWALAAAKAAELARRVREVNAAIEAGKDPIDAIVASLRDSDVLTDEMADVLAKLGISQKEFVQGLLDGKIGVDEFALGVDDLDRQILGLGDSTEIAAATGSNFLNEFLTLPGMKSAREEFIKFIEASSEFTEAFQEGRIRDIKDAFIEAGLGVQFTNEQLDALAQRGAAQFGFKTDPAEIASRIDDLLGRGELQDKLDIMAFRTGRATGEISQSWTEMVLGMEGGGDRIEDFYNDVEEGAGDFKNILQESFNEVKETIMSSFPTWDEYEQTSIESLDAVIEAQDAYLEDLRDGFQLQEELAGEVSAKTVEFIEGLDPQTKGALGRWRRTNETEFNEWIREVEANLEEAEGIIDDFWLSKLPEAQNEGFDAMFQLAVERAQEFDLPGEQTATAIMDGLTSQMDFLTQSQQMDFLAFISGMFQDKDFLNSIGLDIGDPIVDGILAGLGKLATRADSVIRDQARRTKEKIETMWGIRSPSTITEEIGVNITRGLVVGMEGEFDKVFRAQAHPVLKMVNPSPTVNVQAPSGGGSRDLNIYYPEHKEDDILDAVQKAGFLQGIQRMAETTPGMN